MSNIDTFIEKSPSHTQTKNGIVIDTSRDIWEFSDKVVDIKLRFLPLPVTKEIKESIKSTLRWYVENKSPDYTRNLYTHLSYFLEYINESTKEKVSEISSEMLINYRSSLIKRKEYYLGYIAGFLKKWHELCYSGITQDAIRYIESISLTGRSDSIRA